MGPASKSAWYLCAKCGKEKYDAAGIAEEYVCVACGGQPAALPAATTAKAADAEAMSLRQRHFDVFGRPKAVSQLTGGFWSYSTRALELERGIHQEHVLASARVAVTSVRINVLSDDWWPPLEVRAILDAAEVFCLSVVRGYTDMVMRAPLLIHPGSQLALQFCAPRRCRLQLMLLGQKVRQ